MTKTIAFFVTMAWLAAEIPASAQSAKPEYLPICSKCLNPRVTSKTGFGTANAVAEAKVVLEDAKAWCAVNRPRDPICAQQEVTQGGDGGRKFYRATANCTTGDLKATSTGDYWYAGLWEDGPGRGRPKFRDPQGNIPRWESIVSGRGIARSEWDLNGGFSLAGQWETLCGNATPPVTSGARPANAAANQSSVPPRPIPSGTTARPGAPSTVAAAGVQASAPSVCAGQANCREVTPFAAMVTDFRNSNTGRDKLISATVRFQNKMNRPLILGFVPESGVVIDDQGNRYLAYESAVRGIGIIARGQVDPKFVLQPGESSDARLEFLWRPTGREIIGTSYDLDLTVREIVPVAGNQFQLGREHAFHFTNPTGAGPQSGTDVSSAGAPQQNATPAQAVPAATPPQQDLCAGRSRCYSAGLFRAEIAQLTGSIEGNRRDHIVRVNLSFDNPSNQPLILAYVAKSSVVVDNYGTRYYWGTAGTYDMSASGIGKVEGNRADPQFVLRPGESRNATFTLIRDRSSRQPIGTVFTYSVTVAQLEILASQQIRTVREYPLSFQNLTGNAMGAAPATESLSDAAQKIRDAIRGDVRSEWTRCPGPESALRPHGAGHQVTWNSSRASGSACRATPTPPPEPPIQQHFCTTYDSRAPHTRVHTGYSFVKARSRKPAGTRPSVRFLCDRPGSTSIVCRDRSHAFESDPPVPPG